MILPNEGMGRVSEGRGSNTGTEKKVKMAGAYPFVALLSRTIIDHVPVAKRSERQREHGRETGRGSLKGKETTLCYWLKIAAFTWAGAGEVVGVRVMELFRGMVETASVMLSQKGGAGDRWYAVCSTNGR